MRSNHYGSLFGDRRSCLAKDGCNQASEAGMLAQTIERGVYGNRDQTEGFFLVRLFQPFDSALVVAQADEQIGYQARQWRGSETGDPHHLPGRAFRESRVTR